MSTRTFFLGDWNPGIRDPIDVVRAYDAAFIIALTLQAALLVCWARYGWGSVRRVPGENRYEATEAG
jgi:hypothetical protein